MAEVTPTAQPLPHDVLEQQLAEELFGPEIFKVATLDNDAVEDSGESANEAAWTDPDDDEIRVNLATAAITKKLRRADDKTLVTGREYSSRLRSQFEKLHRVPEWTKTTVEDDEEDDETAYLRTTEPLLSGSVNSGQGLAAGRIRLTRMKDANYEAPSEAVIQSVRFHPNNQLLFTAGMDKTLRLFHIGGQTNERLQNVHISDLPILTAEYAKNHTEIWMAGPRPFFYVYDVEGGRVNKIPNIRGMQDRSFRSLVPSPDGSMVSFLCKDGYVAFISTRSKQCIGKVRLNGDVRSIAFSQDGSELYSVANEGEVFIWDVASRRCRRRYHDPGCTKATQIAVNGNVYATGMSSGIVNLYSEESRDTKHSKSFMSLTTPIDSLTFNHDGNLLAMASKIKKDALRLVHIPSQSVFKTWPTSQTPLHYVSSVEFSADSRFLAIGNDRGRVLLYRLAHYL